jgi:nucleotide-binding universal stress UspA family protein
MEFAELLPHLAGVHVEQMEVGADAIVIGARGLGPLDRLLLGSVSTAVVSHAPCSVEVFRPVG